MPNFRIEAPDQDQTYPKGNTESQSYFNSSASDWDWFWALEGLEGDGSGSGPRLSNSPTCGKKITTEAETLIPRAS